MSVVFNIGASSLSFPSESLQANSHYFAVSLSSHPPSLEYQVTLPAWVTRDSLLSVLRYFDTGLIEYSDIYSAQRVLWVAELFECAEMRDKLVERVIVPQVSRENVLFFLQLAYEKGTQGCWSLLWQKCEEIAETQADYLYQYYGKAMEKLPSRLVTSVIRGYFLRKGRDIAADCSPLLQSLLKASEHTNFLDLLASERTFLLSPPLVLLQTLPTPILPEAESTFSSPEFLLGSSRWTLSTVVSAVAGTLQVLLQRVGPEGAQNRVEAVCVCGEVQGSAKSQVEMVIVSGKKKGESWLLVEIDIGEKDEDKTLNVNLWGFFAGLYSALLTHIAHSAHTLLPNASLSLLSSRDLLALLQSPYFSVQSEDMALTSLAKWSSEAPLTPLSPFLLSIRWPYVSTPTILTLFLRFPCLKHSLSWRNCILQEIEQRALGPRINEESPYKKAEKPRKSYEEKTEKQPYGRMSEFLRDVEETLWTSETLRSRWGGKWAEFMRKWEEKETKVLQLRKKMEELGKNVRI